MAVEDKRLQGLPLSRVLLPANETFKRDLEIAVHPSSSGTIIVNFPGANGDIDGYNDKYKTLAYYMQAEGLGAVVRLSNKPPMGESVEEALKKTIEYSLEHSQEISGSKDPNLYVIGTSAGAGAAALIAHEYGVRKLLLMAPAADPGARQVQEGLSRFRGEVYIVIGENDEIVGVASGRWFHAMSTSAIRRELFVIPNCDHQFRGEVNGRVMSQAPFYAFAVGEKPKFPVSGRGIKLY